jgi:alkylation response protein AidB-like acyl-CoA dehydrogenase
MSKATFHWDDPLLLNAQLTDDERQVRDAAHAYCQERLAPRVLEAFRHERTDPAIFREMGELGPAGRHHSRGSTAARAELRVLRAWSRARSSASTRATAR